MRRSADESRMDKIVSFVTKHVYNLSIGIVCFSMVLFLIPDVSDQSAGFLSSLTNVSKFSSISLQAEAVRSLSRNADSSSFDLENQKKRKKLEKLEPIDVDLSAKISVGWNVNLDFILDGVSLMQKLSKSQVEKVPTKTMEKENENGMIHTLEDLFQSFDKSFSQAIASEQRIESAEVFAQVLKTAQEEKVEGDNEEDIASVRVSEWSAGGNAALMANAFSRFGFHEIFLAGPVALESKLIQLGLLEERVTVLPTDGINQDEVHLIMEYAKGASWNGQKADRANRFIVTRDTHNAQLTGLETLHYHLMTSDISPRLLVVSGFHLLAHEEVAVQTQRLARSVEAFGEVNETIPIHLEFASIGNLEFIRTLSDQVFPLVDSLGLNEQELATMFTSLGGKGLEMSSLTSKIPSVNAVASALEFILTKYNTMATANHIRGGLSRIHFHSLTYHMIVKVVTPQKKKKKNSSMLWKNTVASIAGGSLAATLRACNISSAEDMSYEKGEVIAPMYLYLETINGMQEKYIDIVNPVAKWDRLVDSTKNLRLRFYYTPVVVCKSPVQTVGLGDSISASALSYTLVTDAFREQDED